MRRADYTYIVGTCSGRNVIIIEDLDLGNVSVTNDIKNVIKEIVSVENFDPCQYLIVYKDSSGFWDGWDYAKHDYVALQEEDYRDAIDKYILKQLAVAMA
jgi:hypothetical protein